MALTSYRRATWLTDTPGTRVCPQIVRLSSSDQTRRFRRFVTNHPDRVHYPIVDTILYAAPSAERSRRTCVDAPFDASGILGSVGHVIRCGRVSGLEDAACHAPRACMEICRSGPVRLPALDGAPSGMLVFLTRSLDRLPLRSLAPFHIWRQPDDTSLCGCHRRIPVLLSLAQERPSRARHAVGQRDRDQHLRFARASGRPLLPWPAAEACPGHPRTGTAGQMFNLPILRRRRTGNVFKRPHGIVSKRKYCDSRYLQCD